MSDGKTEHEASPRRSSQRTQRYHPPPKEADPIRRNIVKGIGAFGLLGTLGWAASRLFQTGTPDSQPLRSPIAPTLIPSERISPENEAIFQRILNLNQEVLKNPKDFKEIAPRVGNLALEFFCREMGYNPKDYEGRLLFEWHNDFKKLYREKSDCIEYSTEEDVGGTSTYRTREMIFDLSRHLYFDPETASEISPDPAMSLFVTIIHEALHSSAPNIDASNQELAIRKRGLGVLIPNLANSSNTGLCYTNATGHLEEAVVEDATDRLVAKVGLLSGTTPTYKLLVDKYRSGVIDKFFGGNYMILLKLHQQTKQDEFFKLIGARLGYPPEQQYQEAQAYISKLFLSS